MTLEDIGEDVEALLCVTSACCTRAAFGNWFFPNGTIEFSVMVKFGISTESEVR